MREQLKGSEDSRREADRWIAEQRKVHQERQARERRNQRRRKR